MPQQYPIRLDITPGQPVRELPPRLGLGDYMRGAAMQVAAGAPGARAVMAGAMPFMAALNSMRGSGGQMPPKPQTPAPAAPARTPVAAINPGAQTIDDFIGGLRSGKNTKNLSWAALGKAVGAMPAPLKPVAAEDTAGYRAMELGQAMFQNEMALADQDPDPQSRQEKILQANRAYLDLLQMLAANKVTLDQQLNVSEE